MTDDRREGDERPVEDDPDVPLTFLPAPGQPFRWLPKHGKPLCVGEWISQKAVRVSPALTLAIVVVSLTIQILQLTGVL